MSSSTRNTRIRFMDNNLAELTTGQIEKSSELSAFPLTNAIDKFRSKVWKPSGRFLITEDSNDRIYINDGSSKSIQLDSGSYSTPDSLATEIQTKLNSASSGWTVDYNADAGSYRFRFAHASSHILEVSNSTNAVWDTIGFVGSLDITISTEQYADEQRNHTDEYVTFDLGYNATPTFFGVVSPVDSVFPISNAATITLEANNLNQWDSPPLSLTLTPTPGGLHKFMDDISDTGYRFWRFRYIDKFNPEGPTGVQLGYIYLGDYTTLENRNIQSGFEKMIEDPSIIQESESGALFFDRKTKFIRMDGLVISYINKDQRDTLEQLFFDFGVTTPLFVSLDPITCVSNDVYDLTKYVVFDGSPKFQHVKGDIFTMTLKLREII